MMPINLAVQNFSLTSLSREVQVVKFVNALLEVAVKERASDVHIEPLEKITRVRLRIDGFLCTAVEVPRNVHNAIVSRIKIISGMDIAEKRLPQDGRVQLVVLERKVDLRISTLPVINGEKVVIRILDKSQTLLELENLDFTKGNLEIYKRLINLPHGIILLTGPTGSGKSTTLYATLQKLNSITKNIITIEDPIERTIDGINQIAVNTKAGLTFATGLRSIVRQDPNIIMVGEIRDAETARIAVQAALTGHLVFSTLHTNSAVGAVTRLLDIGIEPFLLAAALRGVVAQRLVRRVCIDCQKQYEASEMELTALGCDTCESFKLNKGNGCENCNHTGYKGRIAVQEVLEITPVLQKAIIQGAEECMLLKLASDSHFTSLSDDCREKVLTGTATVEELMRIAYC
ncbi:MAG: type II/IV secretion system protein [Phascolarctobacterium sp.]|nr:type II/IV secretion system protein [Phascolarctobacterium sp.]